MRISFDLKRDSLRAKLIRRIDRLNGAAKQALDQDRKVQTALCLHLVPFCLNLSLIFVHMHVNRFTGMSIAYAQSCSE